MQLLHTQLADDHASALILVSGSDPFALGHYPGNPIYPGVLTAEHLCRLAQRLCSQVAGHAMHVVGIQRMQYLDAIVPGDVVELRVSVQGADADARDVKASAWVGGKAKARATLRCSATAPPPPAGWVPQALAVEDTGLEHRALGRVLPHRYPFLLVDRVCSHAPGRHIVGTRVVSAGLPALLGLPTEPYPQALVVESLGQIGIALFFLSRGDSPPVDIVLGSMSDVDFCRPVPLDAVLTLHARIERLLPNGVILSGQALCGDAVVTRVGSLVAMVDPRHAPA
jgi:3-hydroxymyristoyl/3-hydroxydecanoyl-(acyl carrier protein) dehydratase